MNKIKEFDEDELEHNYKKYKESKEDLTRIESDINLKETQIKHLEESLEEAKDHEFDEDCEYCVKNSQWHIEKTKSLTNEIKDCKLELDEILAEKSYREKGIESFGDINKDRVRYQELKEDLKQVENDAYKTQAKIKELEASVLSLEKDLEKIYEQNKRI